MKLGDILRATNRDSLTGLHPIIFYKDNSDLDFIGAMLTHYKTNKNIEMIESHFERYNENGDSYIFQFDNTKLVIAKLIKFNIWGPFTIIGRLTNSGIDFVSNIIDPLIEQSFEDYKKTN